MESIITALNTIKAGSFCAKRTLTLDQLQVDVKSWGSLKLPLTPRQIKSLIQQAKPAKFGLRDKTVLDKRVRDVWEITKSQVLEKTQWKKTLVALVNQLKLDLGLPETATFKPALHNLLIYEPGQFFDYHQDSEKQDGMIATLLVILPASHTGGTLTVDHQGTKKHFQSSRFSLDQLTCIAFYADCHHSIRPVTTGYRVVLTYNLILEPATHLKHIDIQQSNEAITQGLNTYFSEHSARSESPRPFVYLLDHSYTQKGLSWKQLKNSDAVRAQSLRAVAETLALEASMALADVQETWDCEVDDVYYRKSRAWAAPFDVDNVTVTDLLTTDTVLKHWIDREDHPLPYQPFSVSSNHVGWTKASQALQPFESVYEGFMGNYGNTFDRWYHRAAIVLWRQQDHYPMRFAMDPNAALSEVLHLTQQQPPAAVETIDRIIRSLLPHWNCLRQRHATTAPTVFQLAAYIQNASLASTMLTVLSINALNPTTANLFLTLQTQYHTPWCITLLQAWAQPKRQWDIVEKYEIVVPIIKALSHSQQAQPIIEWILAYQLERLKTDHACQTKSYGIAWMKQSANRIKTLLDLIQACLMADHSTLYREILNHILTHVELYPAIELVRVIDYLKIHLKSDPLRTWDYSPLWDHVITQLTLEKDRGLRQKDDWSIPVQLSCHCPLCQTLQQFLQSTTVRTLPWPLSKDRRQHIHRAIDALEIPVTHETIHTGSPHTLVLTKTEKLHQEAKKQFERVCTTWVRLTTPDKTSVAATPESLSVT